MTTVAQEGRPYWLSWYQRKDYPEFELHTPWWVSGWRVHDGAATICAAVTAPDEDAAREVVLASFDQRPADVEFRFVTLREPGAHRWRWLP